MARNRGSRESYSKKSGKKQKRNIHHAVNEIEYTVDVTDLLFSPSRDFLVTNNGQQVKADDLRGKTIVLFICPLHTKYMRRKGVGDALDMAEAYNQLLRMGSAIEFVFVPVQIDRPVETDWFDYLLSTLPFPAVPLSDVASCGGRVMDTFSVCDFLFDFYDHERVELSTYWVVIDPTHTVVETRFRYCNLFKLFNGEELHPLSGERISTLMGCYKRQSREQLISNWDQLLASPPRDFLLSSNGDKVLISSLKGKLVGLYFCGNIPYPPRMQVIKEVYKEAKLRGYDFEIVQINFHFYFYHAKESRSIDMSVQRCCENVSWLTLPFKDPSCRKIQRIYEWHYFEHRAEFGDWEGDCLVLVHPDGLFEFSGADIFERWGIQGYPFTEPSLFKAELDIQKRELTLQSLFPPGELFHRHRSAGHIDFVDASQLLGKRVIVVFTKHFGGSSSGANILSTLRSKYDAQEFEVVYVSSSCTGESLESFTKDMPWLVRPFHSDSPRSGDILVNVCFKAGGREPFAVAFNEEGVLIAKQDYLDGTLLPFSKDFPFIDQNLENRIRMEVGPLSCMGGIYDERLMLRRSVQGLSM